MKKSILLLLALMPLMSFTQMTFSFENGSFDGWTINPQGRWAVDTTEALSGRYSLHHVFDNSSASTDAASFSIKDLCFTCSSVTWSFTLRHGYPPSASNRWAFVLSSDISTEGFATATGYNGFVLGVNLQGYDDTLRLYRVKGTALTKVISPGINWEKDIGSAMAAQLTIIREAGGMWRLEVKNANGTSFGEWTGADIVETVPVSAGIVYTYTSSADRMLWLDDVSVTGTFEQDLDPPEIVKAEASSLNSLIVSFNEEIKDTKINPASVTMLSGETAVSAEWLSSCTYVIKFPGFFFNKTENTLKISNLCDGSENCAGEVIYSFTPAFVEAGDVVISEIMFDPSPPAGLPEEEYVEIMNLSDFSFPTEGWMLIAGSDTSYFPVTFINKGEISILCSNSDTTVFRQYGRVIGMKSFPVLNDSGEAIALRDIDGKMIHALNFGPELYNDNARSGGGWSAEMTDTEFPFNAPEAWSASQNSAGGTPGRINSVKNSAVDHSCPQLLTVFPHDNKSIELWFDETMKDAIHPEYFMSDGLTAVAVKSTDITDMTFLVEFDALFDENKIYRLVLSPLITDFAGNGSCLAGAFFAMPQEAAEGEILFNEVMFNPVHPCTDYIELYNNSESAFDLSEYYFTSTNTDTGEESVAVRVCSFPRLILPGELAVLTTARDELPEHYLCANGDMIYETEQLPSMPDDEGIITLYDKGFKALDRIAYSSSWHLIFISDDEGVSLEKVSPLLPSGVISNWHSASENCNWGSPGMANSVMLPANDESDGVTLSAERVSPDGDGYEDVVSVNVFPGGEDNVVSIKIYSDRGVMVQTLADRFYAGCGARFIWDGTACNNEQLSSGLYLISITVYNATGEVKHWKKVCAVLYR